MADGLCRRWESARALRFFVEMPQLNTQLDCPDRMLADGAPLV